MVEHRRSWTWRHLDELFPQSAGPIRRARWFNLQAAQKMAVMAYQTSHATRPSTPVGSMDILDRSFSGVLGGRMRLITHHTVPICSKNMRRSLAEMVCLTIAISLVSSVHRGFQRLFRMVSPCVTLVIVSSPPRNTIGASRSRAYMNSSGQPTVSTLICLPNNESANLPFQALAARSLRSLQHTCSGRVSSVAHFISLQHTNSTTTPRRPPAYMYVSLYVFQQIFLSRG